MKKALFTFVFFSLFAFTASAQVPQAFKYQAVVRDAAGQVLANQNVSLRIRLTPADSTITLYTETHTGSTNAFGLVNLNVGRGMVVSGQFGMIDWAQPVYIHLGLDLNGGTAYEDMGVSELLSVPYALYAANTAGSSGLPANAEKGDLLYHDGTAWQRLPAGIPDAVLTMGNDGLPIWKHKFQQFFGTYNVSEVCGGQSFAYPITIGPSASGAENEIILNNFGSYNLPVPGTVAGNDLTINAVVGGYTFIGTGTFSGNGNVLTYTNTTSISGQSENCSGTATRQ